ncbi:primosomal protein DnaI [Microaerobacter geothermalis]|uniref:primosomal protein DnaI n=1 Tax=Microaerobacter geothermalis TaxID=674972 RepID=UPI001F194FA7|nr:primosomal protein DnaI [Microaerobacter geothermalis]MCF6092978.1 primosomal protein DnaI [Microaerobacter geothermalis]
MKSIDGHLIHWVEQVKQRKGENKGEKDILNHPYVVSFLKKSSLSPEMIKSHLPTVIQVVQEQENCKQCPGLEKCTNMAKGYAAHLSLQSGMVSMTVRKCNLLRRDEEQKYRQSLIRSHHISSEVLHASFHTMNHDKYNKEAIKAAAQFCMDMQMGKPVKGLYFYGPFGVGKSYIMGALAQLLANHRIASYMVYVPEIFREMKEAIQKGEVPEKMKALKEIPVLILDDIGAENVTPWVRDEILGSVLQYRISNHLPTLYTSNFNYEELEEHFTYSTTGQEELKAKRIMERIRYYTQDYLIDGPNRRK